MAKREFDDLIAEVATKGAIAAGLEKEADQAKQRATDAALVYRNAAEQLIGMMRQQHVAAEGVYMPNLNRCAGAGHVVDVYLHLGEFKVRVRPLAAVKD